MSNSAAKRPVVVDLFAGAGGLSLGFEQAGFDVAVAVEFDPIHAAIHELNFPDTKVLCRDVRDLTGDELREQAGLGRRAIDVVIGGPPCQGFSLIGHRVLKDPRNELVFHFLRLVSELRPKVFMMENVPGMATGAHHELLDELVRGFREAEYRIQMPISILNARDFGVPQDRRRVFVLGARNGVRLPEYPKATTFFDKANGRATGALELEFDASNKPPTPTVRDAIGDLPDIESFDSLMDSDILRARLGKPSPYAEILRGDRRDRSDYSYPRVYEKGTISGCQRAEHTVLSRARFSKTAPGETEPISRFYRLPPEGLCNTLRAGTATDRGAFSAPRPIHPVHARCISVREAARLHSYPDWFRFHRTIWHGFRQIGNSVPPLLGRAVAGEVMRALGQKPSKPARKLTLLSDELASLTMKDAAAHFGVSSAVIAPRRRLAAGAVGG
jgi:DNA (cytosine-5)-methyltransferase 1